jgi:PAS domain S-box-containing protein
MNRIKRIFFEVLVAIVFVGGVFVIIELFADVGVMQSGFLLSILAVVLSTWYGGFNSGMIAVIFAVFINTYYFMSPENVFYVQGAEDIWRILIFTFVATLVSFLISERTKSEESERRRKEWFRVTIASIGDGIIVTDPDGKIQTINSVAEQLTGWKQSEAETRSIEEVIQVSNLAGEKIENPVMKLIRDKSVASSFNQSLLLGRSGISTLIDESASPIKSDTGEMIGIVLVIRDISEKRRAEYELERSTEQLRLAMEGGNLGIWDWSIKTGELKWFGNLEKLHGIPAGSAPKDYESFRKIIHKDDRESFERAIQDSLKNRTDFSVEFRVRWEDASIHWVGGIGRPLYENGAPVRMVGIGIDLTERKNSEETIASQLKQKEILLKEVHHRVKNNLQVISSLLSLQALKSDDASRDALIESRSRIQSMALIHEKLYQSQDLSKIDLGQYIKDLATILYNTYGTETEKVKFDLTSKGVMVDIDTAIPCGLIANEILSNSLKHAFPANRNGVIECRLSIDNEAVCIDVSDDGVGFSSETTLEQSTSLGLKLISSLVRQLQGSVEVFTDSGTHFVIRVPLLTGVKSGDKVF